MYDLFRNRRKSMKQLNLNWYSFNSIWEHWVSLRFAVCTRHFNIGMNCDSDCNSFTIRLFPILYIQMNRNLYLIHTIHACSIFDPPTLAIPFSILNSHSLTEIDLNYEKQKKKKNGTERFVYARLPFTV